MEQFDGKTVFITGAASGIGRAAALAFAKQGANLILTDINQAEGEETLRRVDAEGQKNLFLRVDVTDSESIQQALKQTVERFGKLDIALNNAGVFQHEGPPADVDEALWHKTIAINLTGVFLCMKYELQQMATQHNGIIVNMSSVLGLRGAAEAPAYVASKHGVIGLTKSAAIAYAQQGIRVNAICPGIIETPMEQDLFDRPDEYNELLKLYPMRRSGTPHEVVGPLLWLCSDASSYVTGAIIPIDGGHMAY